MIKAKLKMAVKIWLAIYPSITLFHYLIGDAMSDFSLPVKTLILTLVLVPWVVFVGMPAIDLLQKFLSKNETK